MRILFIISACLLINLCRAQEGRKYTFPEIGWSFTLPPDFHELDSAGNAGLTEKGKKSMEDANGVELDFSHTRTLITAMKDGFNYFNATIAPYNTEKDGNYQATNQTVKDMTFKTFSEKMPGFTIDTSTAVATIDGIEFDAFHVKVYNQEKVLFNMYLLAKLYRGYDFGISYLYLDESTQQEIETLLAGSKFSR